MKTVIVFRAIDQKEQRTVRFTADSAPALLVGDTFSLPWMVNFGCATVLSRHWRGEQLVLSCKVTYFLIAYLAEKATKMKGFVDDYELPDQNWSQPFEE